MINDSNLYVISQAPNYAQPAQPVYATQYGTQPVYGGQPQPQAYPPPHGQYAPPPGPSMYGAPAAMEAGDYKYTNLPPPKPPTINAKPRFHDVWATILFLVVNLVLIGCAVVGVPEAIKSVNNSTDHSNSGSGKGTSTSSPPPNNGTDFTLSGKEVGGVVGAAVGVGFLFSAVYFVAMMLIAGPLIHITYWLSFIVLLALTAFYVMAKAYVAAVIFAIFCVLFAINYFFIRNRIPFARIMLQSCTRIISQFSGTIFVGLAGLIFSCIYCIVWIVTFVGLTVVLRNKGVGSGATYAIFVFLLFILYWTSEVTRNTVHVAVSGTFATVYFTGHSTPGSNRIEVPDKAVTLKATGRALTTSFGPICFGSMLVAIIQTLRALANQAKNQAADDGNIFMCLLFTCVTCILACFQDLFEYFNKYAYTQVAIYGKSYCDAAKDTWKLIQTRGLEAVINDNLIGNVLFIGSLLSGLVCAFVGFIVVKASDAIADTTANFVIVCILSALIGMWLFLILAEVITSGVATTYVCIAEDPATLARQQPELFAELHRAWPEIQWGMNSTVGY
ncbi:putative choline transporter, neither null mutation nor overexpression affects choline transport [Phlyctochytrium planicorne]|nr:putative choline transporter, neither null mutation nor overexpression affects choline transport [Phlyctochytrium planicorne]